MHHHQFLLISLWFHCFVLDCNQPTLIGIDEKRKELTSLIFSKSYDSPAILWIFFWHSLQTILTGQICECITISFCLLFYYSFVLDCNQPTLIGDGYCNDEVNILDCGYDGGDCCGSCINTDLCTNCSCLGSTIGNGVPNPLVGNGYCNDNTNNVHCLYDGLDCCRSLVNTDSCSDCLCHGESIIIQNLSLLKFYILRFVLFS